MFPNTILLMESGLYVQRARGFYTNRLPHVRLNLPLGVWILIVKAQSKHKATSSRQHYMHYEVSIYYNTIAFSELQKYFNIFKKNYAIYVLCLRETICIYIS